MAGITRSQSAFLDGVVALREIESESLACVYMARHLVQCTLPHSDPGKVSVWCRRNGHLQLSIVPGVDGRTGESFGYPYGTLPRLILFWIVREATVTRSRRLHLGSSLAAFMRELGLNPSNGSGKRSDGRRLRHAMRSLFRATISFDLHRSEGLSVGEAWLDMKVAPKGLLWWDKTGSGEGSRGASWIELGEDFYHAVVDRPVPVYLEALRLLKGSSLALDLYAWTSYRVSYLERSLFIPWDRLSGQFGSGYRNPKEFQRKASAALRKVRLVYPALKLDFVKGSSVSKGGIRLHPSRTAVPRLPKRGFREPPAPSSTFGRP